MNSGEVPVVPQCTYCNETPYLIAAMVSQGLAPGFTMTTVVKASYRLVPGEPLTPLVPQVQFRGHLANETRQVARRQPLLDRRR